MEKKLYRSRKEDMIAGVCGGIAEYFNVDPTIVRLIYVVFLLFSVGSALLVYLIACIIIPKEPESPNQQQYYYPPQSQTPPTQPVYNPPSNENQKTSVEGESTQQQ